VGHRSFDKRQKLTTDANFPSFMQSFNSRSTADPKISFGGKRIISNHPPGQSLIYTVCSIWH